ncbi:MAG TPA: hypothetical protein VGQ12_17650 [Candidatus Angelobacter sp.]|jgi:hypothetical protein|nr:hypothetical protein [Candidatus Angelobacter sp.]
MPLLLYFILFSMFSWLIFSLRSRKAMALLLIGAVTIASLVVPQPAQAQGGIITIIQQVLTLINGFINQALTAINTARSTLNNFRQVTIFPQQLIQQAKSRILGMVGQFRQVMAGILNLNIRSASLPTPQTLESLLRGHQVSGIGNITPAFNGTFGSVPTATDANPTDRAMSDMDDALAQDSLKLTVATDSATDVELRAADSLEDAAGQSAPGSAPFLTAAALSATVRSQALAQKMYAAELREEAAHLAHHTEIQKHGATSTTNLRQALHDLLEHR